MIIPGEKKAARAVIRLSVPLLLILVVLIASILIIYSIPVLTEEKRTSGNLTFTDRAGIPVSGTIEISMTGAPSGGRPDVNTVMWKNAPNARIYFAAHETKNVSIDLRISEDSPNGRVSLEDYGAAIPEGVDQPAPGIPVKYVELHSTGVTFADANLSIYYTDAELNGLDEKSLAIYIYEGASWTELPTRVDPANNAVSATVDTLSVFALSARENEEVLKKFRELIIPAKETLESDALKTKGVAVKLTINKRGDGQIKLEDYGKKNPVAVAPPGNAVKFVDISAENISFESAEVRIRYTDEELGGSDESALVIYHWNGAAWDALATSVDTVNNLLAATTASLSPFAVSGGTVGPNRILVATNRYVVLDAPRPGSTAQSPYVTPYSTDAFNTNYWTGKQTTIGVRSLFIDSNGKPLSGKTVNFTIYKPNNSIRTTGTNITDSSGVASFYHSLDEVNFYGNWTVKAESGGIYDNATFVYNWWGCAWNQGSCAGQHSGVNPGQSGTTSPNSPYTASWEQITTAQPEHYTLTSASWADNYCTVCHQSYDGNPTKGITAATTTKDFYTPDVHRNIRCDNASCHNPGASYANHNAGTITIGSCTSASCHPRRSDITMKSTLNGIVSNYSNSSSGGIDDYHTPNYTVPCIICHGPMHNITKPNESQHWINNTVTEDSHCTECHTSYQRHNSSNTSSGGVNCTLCHSDDVHYIQVFARNSTGGAIYVNATNTSRGNCTLCHQNSVAFFNSLEANPDAGKYLGRDPPQVASPVRHSNDANAGKKWNQTSWYWTYSNQLTWCKYCHGETNHKSVALGRPSTWDGNNVVNSTIGNTTWCAGCHWQLYANGTNKYQDMVNNFSDDRKNITPSSGYNLSIPPEITGNATYGANKSNPAYFNHSDISIKSDNSCYGCHRNGTSAVSITGFMHNLTDVSTRVSGPDCIGCHDYNKTDADALHRINNSDMESGIHANLNKNATNSAGVNPDNRKCWGCHTSNGSEPRPYYLNYYDMGDRYANPYQCYECHNSTGKAYANVSAAPQVDQHFKGGSNVTAASAASDNSSSCVVCHDVNELKISYTENDPYNSGLSNASHYTRNRTDLRTWDSGRAANCSYCHQNSSTAFFIAMIYPASNRNISNHSVNNSPTCYNSTCHNSGWIHNLTLDRPAFNSTNTSSFCQICHAGKQKHNGTQDCNKCHINRSSSDTIHPIKFIQIWSNFSNSSATAANCTNCHQGAGITNFSSAPIIPDPLKHSSNLSNGSIWNSTNAMYWTSGNSSCYYCHSDTKHNSTALGNISALENSINVLGGSLTTTRWCADCHYNDSSNANYKGNRWTPVPPVITINNTGKNYWVNHSRYFAGGYNDSVCEACHGLNGSYGATSLNYSHSLDEGVAGGPNCILCHNLVTGLQGGAPAGINFTAANASVHFGMNSNNATNRGFVPVTGACWACHDSDGNVTSGHPDKYMAPKTCTECHLGTGTYNASAYNATVVSQHYYSGTNVTAGNSTSNISSCISCHENVSEMLRYNNDTDTGSFTGDGVRLNGGNKSFYHYGKDRSDLRVGTSANCSYCHQNSSTAFAGAMVNPAYNRSIQNHSTSNPPACTNSTCHNPGWIHNSTLDRPGLNATNTSSFCQNCHVSKQKHNGTQDCNKCHINQSGSDTIHPIKYLQINRSFLTSNSSAVNCTNCHQAIFPNFTTAPIIPDPLKHSSNATNGTIWGTYWNSEGGACYYCHSNTKHNSTAIGNISALLNSNNVKNGSLATTRWCVDCHYNDSVNANYRGNQWNPAPPLITVNNTGKSGWINHSSYVRAGYNDTNCKSCHALNGSYAATSLNYSHSLDEGVAGGPNCISCHYIGSPYHNIDNITANSSAHFGMNSGNATNTGIAAINGACWACHDTDGNITNNPAADIMGDLYSTPKTCTDCHLSGGQYYSQAVGWGGLTVAQHYQNGTSISTGNSSSNISSCINCHENVSEMLLSNSDPDTGTFTGDGVRLTGGNMSFYHYGKNRTELRAWNSNTTANCSYCHKNTSTAFAIAMIDPAYNRSISNHSTIYNSSNPTCYVSQCHNTGWIHNSTLAKPAANTTFCLNCHGKNATSGLINFTGAVTSIKEKHNNSVNCTECHLNTAKDVHPVKYLRQDATYSTINNSAATCITCHQTSSVDSKLTLSPPKVPLPMHHSDNASNGTIWNSTAYWTPATPLTSCTYCHNDSKHNATALGRPAKWQGNNVVNSSLGTGTWCASCHYKNYTSGGKNYSDTTQAFTSANLSVPPEITNGSYAIKIYSRSNYYNHSLKDYSDGVCWLCHGVNLSSTSTVSELMHNITSGSCTGCHYSFEAMNNTTRPDRYVDSGMYNTSLHRQLSCTNCHTQGHRNIGARKACEDCHAVQANPVTDKDRHNITSTPSTYFISASSVVTITDCTTCHSSTLYNTATATYGYWKPKDCDYCHTYPDKYYQ